MKTRVLIVVSLILLMAQSLSAVEITPDNINFKQKPTAGKACHLRRTGAENPCSLPSGVVQYTKVGKGRNSHEEYAFQAQAARAPADQGALSADGGAGGGEGRPGVGDGAAEVSAEGIERRMGSA